MDKQYRVVVFDWEGTLGDTLGQILNCVAEQAEKLGFGELDTHLARQVVDLGLVNASRRLFPHLTTHQHEALLLAVQQSMATKHADVYLLPGARQIVERVHAKNIGLAIASNKSQQGLQRALHQTCLDTFFQVTCTADQFPSKPSPQMLQEIMKVFHVEANELLMVGDSTIDMQMATNVGADGVAVNFYNLSVDSLLEAGALVVFDDFDSLATYLNV